MTPSCSSTRSKSSSILAWRSMNKPKKSIPASISLIFAEPEHGSPLDSATTKLIPVREVSSSSLDSEGGTESGKHVHDESKPTIPDSQPLPDPDNDIANVKTSVLSPPSLQPGLQQDNTTISGTSVSQIPESTQSGDEPCTDVETPKPSMQDKPSSLPSTFSWFGSWTRSSETQTTAEHKEPASESTDTPPVQIQPPTPPLPSLKENGISHPQLIVSQSSNNDPQPSALSLPSRPSILTKPSTLSVDDEVPQLPPPVSTSTPSNQSPNIHSNDRTSTPKLTSLNPSSSRFTLSVPLLGRPKIPLEQALAAAQQTAVTQRNVDRATATQPGVPKETVATKDKSPTIIEVLEPNSNEEPTTPAPGQTDGPTDEAHTATNTATMATWWDYIGWRSSNTLGEGPSTSSNLPSTVKLQSASMPDLHVESETSTSPDVTRDVDVPRKTASYADLPQPEPSPEAKSELLEPPKPQSISSGESYTSAWYSPWSWYGSAPAANDTQLPESDVKTPSELVKEEALSRDDAQPVEPQPEQPVSPVVLEQNPIESSISTHKSVWASFFSSQSLLVKSIGNSEKTDDNGMEVMDLDEEEESSSPPTASLAMAEANKKSIVSPLLPTLPNSMSENATDSGKCTTATPLTESNSIKRTNDKLNESKRNAPSPSPSKRSANVPPATPRPPNLVLPTWGDTFHAAPRSLLPPQPTSKLTKTLKMVSNALFLKDEEATRMAKDKARERMFGHFGKGLPRAWDVLGHPVQPDTLQGARRVVVIGVHGWFPGTVMRTVIGEPTGTSSKFANMMVRALEDFQEKYKVKFEKVTKIPLEGEGTIGRRVDKLYSNLLKDQGWMDDLHTADVIFVATHSQGSVVSTHLLDRLIQDRHIRTARNTKTEAQSLTMDGVSAICNLRPQRICCLGLCGIHLGPLRYLSTSSVLQPYIQYFESTAARELFEFQDTASAVSQAYVKALQNVVNHGTKMVYVASFNDQVVPIYSGLFTSASHPLILRALYIDGDAYQTSDFLSNLLVLLLRVLNSGLSDSGLLAHLSEATAGSLNGVGHSTAYEDLATYSLAVDYLFLTNDGLEEHPELVVEPYNATAELNDYEIPWALRDLIADERVVHFFGKEIIELRNAFREWQPKTAILKDIKRKLQPIQRLPSRFNESISGSASKL